jgi:hypothetical protein
MTSTALSRLGDPGLWREVPAFVIGALVNTSEESGIPLPEVWVWVGLAGVGLCVLSCAPLGRLRFWVWMIGTLAVACLSWKAVILADRYRAVHSLLLPSPFLLLALLPIPKVPPRPFAMAFVETLSVVYLVVYLVLAFLICGVQGGAEWGTRYALVLYPLLAIVAGVRFQAFLTSAETGQGCRTAVTIIACGLFGLGLLFSVRGVGEIRRTKQDLSAFSREVNAGAGVVVTDHWWLAAALAPTFAEREFYTVVGQGEFAVWLERVGCRTRRFVYASYAAEPAEETELGSLGLRLVEKKAVNGMRFTHYEVTRP